MVGHIKLDRKIINWEWYSDVNMAHLFIYFILKANFKDGKWRGVLVKRGQLITGRLKISKDTGLSERQIRTCINKLKMTNEITVQTTNQFSIITICKYDNYQSKCEDIDQRNDQQQDQRATNERPTSDQRATTIEEELIRRKEEEKNKFLLIGLYEKKLEEVKELFPSTTKDGFYRWKKFVNFVYENSLSEIFKYKVINPGDFSELNFPEELWDETIRAILGTGIKEEHNLFFRIPQFIEIINLKKSKIKINGAKRNHQRSVSSSYDD